MHQEVLISDTNFLILGTIFSTRAHLISFSKSNLLRYFVLITAMVEKTCNTLGPPKMKKLNRKIDT
jgi:hypothetical protein